MNWRILLRAHFVIRCIAGGYIQAQSVHEMHRESGMVVFTNSLGRGRDGQKGWNRACRVCRVYRRSCCTSCNSCATFIAALLKNSLQPRKMLSIARSLSLSVSLSFSILILSSTSRKILNNKKEKRAS